MVATPTGFEPAISALTGLHVKPLHHGAAVLNAGQSSQLAYCISISFRLHPVSGLYDESGGRYWSRTSDLCDVNAAL